ncbi:hypothetical protein QJS04_geneDACA016817 [Acorus gramineus]|uniref:Uncharacterized protein n=1 Tax=Acorus gramineus TaxID=55184 RepID=A0AAV8ZZG6_ACOGR|nr:hypothetical protein QJS04_geneDACA016817 [Acorus gramineus]
MQIDQEPKLVTKKARSDDQGIISFSNGDREGVQAPHSNHLVITLRISNYDIKRILVDTRSSTDILFMQPYLQMGLKATNLTPTLDPLIAFNRA